MKLCKGPCKEFKSFTEYNKKSDAKDKHQTWCKLCQSEQNRIYEKRPEVIALRKSYVEKNREKIRISKKKYEAKHPDRVKKTKRRWEKENPDIKKKWQENNVAKVKKTKKKWKDNNKKYCAEYNSGWAKLNRGKTNAYSNNYRAKKLRVTPSWLTEEHWKQIEWFYLEASRLTIQTGILHEVDHILPLQGKEITGLHVPWNLQILKHFDNSKKHRKFDFTYDNMSWSYL